MVSEDGALETLVGLLGALLLAAAAVFAVLLGLLARHEQAAGAADFAALAAASTGDCAAARESALRNGADVLQCELGDDGARVTVSVPTRLPGGLVRAGAPVVLTARAHAIT